MKGLIRANDLDIFRDFAKRSEQLGIVTREAPADANRFFSQLLRISFGLAGKVNRERALEDIQDLLQFEIPVEIQSDPFYERWLADMANVSRTFCDTQRTDAICFWLGSQRGCRRYHTDNVPLRMLVTYAGKGTEWLPDEAADRLAYANGAPNGKIVKDSSAPQFLKEWEVAIFRGGSKGVLHRTPDAALNGPSILMRLDHPSFWDQVLNRQR